MTEPTPVRHDAPALVAMGVRELVATARRLGLVWRLHLATVSVDQTSPYTTVEAMLDGDEVTLTMVNLTGTILAQGDRIAAIQVPPSGTYAIGVLGPSLLAAFDLTRAAFEAFGGVSITPVANTPTAAAVSYTLSGAGTVAAFATANTAVPGSQVLEVSVASVTSTGMNVMIYRTNTTVTTVYWLAKQAIV